MLMQVVGHEERQEACVIWRQLARRVDDIVNAADRRRCRGLDIGASPCG